MVDLAFDFDPPPVGERLRYYTAGFACLVDCQDFYLKEPPFASWKDGGLWPPVRPCPTHGATRQMVLSSFVVAKFRARGFIGFHSFCIADEFSGILLIFSISAFSNLLRQFFTEGTKKDPETFLFPGQSALSWPDELNYRYSSSSGPTFSFMAESRSRMVLPHMIPGPRFREPNWMALKNERHACPTTVVLGRGPLFSNLISSMIDAISEWRISSCQLK